MGTASRRSFSSEELYEMMHRQTGGRYYKKDYSDPVLQNPELCKRCGGQCCKRCGCFFSPDDFAVLSFEALVKEIEKGYITLELIDLGVYNMEGVTSNFSYIVRARNVDGPIVENRLIRPCGQCVLLGEEGCKMDFEHRPSGGRLLVPQEDGKCSARYGVEQCIREWLNYQKTLQKLADFFGNALPKAI